MTRRLSITMPKSGKWRFLGLKRRLSKISDRSLDADKQTLHEETPPASTPTASIVEHPPAPVVDIVDVDDEDSPPHDDDDDDDVLAINAINASQENETPPASSPPDVTENKKYCHCQHHPNDLATKAAEEKKASVRESLPPSLSLYADERDTIAPFRRDEINLGPLLGSGEFSHVYEVESFSYFSSGATTTTTATPTNPTPTLGDDSELGCNSNSNNIAFTKEESKKRAYMKKCEKYQQTENARYALKHIKGEYLEDAIEKNDVDAYVQAARDLSLEAEILAALNHPNIIKLRGTTHSGSAGFSQGPCGYFLIVDRLFETLDQRIKRWSHEEVGEVDNGIDHGSNSKNSCKYHHHDIKTEVGQDGCKEENMNDQHNLNTNNASGAFGMKDELLDERLSIALQISAAMIYLHSHSIIFRDLKPANIGFDVRGDVKIFDFGLARIMPDGHHYNDTYKMSGAGSPRFMAPECLCGEPYNMKADVYSFAIVFWGMLTGDKPYAFAKTMYQLVDYVVNKDGRPAIHERWPANIKQMLERCFDGDTERRPEMTFVHRDIKSALASLRGGNRKGLSESYIVRRRSFESFQLNSFIANDLDLSKIVLSM